MYKGYFFISRFDAGCYLILTVLYPILSYIVQLTEFSASNSKSVYNMLISGLFFTLAYYYDFYIRRKGINVGPKFIKHTLTFGWLFFVLLSVAIGIAFIFFALDVFSAESIAVAFYIIPISSVLPFGIALYDLVIDIKGEDDDILDEAFTKITNVFDL